MYRELTYVGDADWSPEGVMIRMWPLDARAVLWVPLNDRTLLFYTNLFEAQRAVTQAMLTQRGVIDWAKHARVLSLVAMDDGYWLDDKDAIWALGDTDISAYSDYDVLYFSEAPPEAILALWDWCKHNDVTREEGNGHVSAVCPAGDQIRWELKARGKEHPLVYTDEMWSRVENNHLLCWRWFGRRGSPPDHIGIYFP